MRSRSLRLGHALPLLLAPLAAPLVFVSPAKAAFAPSCCVMEGEAEPGHPHPEIPPPVLVGAKVRNPEERALEATAEAPITAEAPLEDAIGIPLNELPELPQPVRERVPIIAGTDSLPALGVDDHGGSIDFPGCCQAEGETHPPDRDPEEKSPPVLVGAKVENRIERALKVMAAELPIPNEAPLVNAIGIPLDAGRGVSEPEHVPVTAGIDDHDAPCCTVPEPDDPDGVPVTVDAHWRWLAALRESAEAIVAMLVLLMAAALWFLWPRRRTLTELEPLPVTRPLPDELPRPDAAPVPLFEPVTAPSAKLREAERELEPA